MNAYLVTLKRTDAFCGTTLTRERTVVATSPGIAASKALRYARKNLRPTGYRIITVNELPELVR